MHGTPVTVDAAYPQSTLNGTLTCSSHSSTASYETYVVGRRNLCTLCACISQSELLILTICDFCTIALQTSLHRA